MRCFTKAVLLGVTRPLPPRRPRAIHCRHRAGHVGRGAARRDGRGGQPGPHREDPYGRHRRHRSVPPGEPRARPLHRHLHADRLFDRSAERRRRSDRRDGHPQYGAARRRRGRDHHRDRRDAGRGHPEQHARAEGARRRARLGAAGDSRLRQPAGDGARHSGDGAREHRHRAGDELLHLARRPEQRRHDPDRRHERRVGVQRGRRVELRLRHVELRRSPDHDRRRPGRDRPRRAAVQPRPEDRRQHLQRDRTSAASPASGRRAATSTTRCARTASPIPPRCSRAGTRASPSADRS